MKRVLVASLVLSFVVLSVAISSLHAAALHTPVLPGWGRPTTIAGANANGTTYQEWNAMSPTATVPNPSAPLAAPTLVNPNASGPTQPVFYDNGAPGDGAFQAGTDIYSFASIITPVVVIPGYNISGNQLSVSVEVQSFGSVIDASDLTASYVDPEGNSHVIDVSTLPTYTHAQAYNDGGSNFGGLGTAYLIDNLWTFTLPQDTSSLSLQWGWGVTSAALQAISVDTRSVAVPEPTSLVLGLLSAAAGMVACRSRRRKQSRT